MDYSSLMLIAILAHATVIEVMGQCPPPTKIYEAKPTCRDDYDCSKYGRVCCMTSRGVKACAQPDKYGQDKYYKEPKYGTGVYCGNIKCSPFQQCMTDPRTGRKICSHR